MDVGFAILLGIGSDEISGPPPLMILALGIQRQGCQQLESSGEGALNCKL